MAKEQSIDYDLQSDAHQMKDPNNTSPLDISGGGPFKGKEVPDYGRSKITKTDMSGDSGRATGSSYAQSLDSQKAGGKIGVGTVVEGTTLPVASPVDPLTFGDPNDTSLDFRDGMDPNSVTIRGGGTGDIEHRGFDTPAFPG